MNALHVNGDLGLAEYAMAWLMAVGESAREAVASLEDAEAVNAANMDLVLYGMGV
jgi:hypothetical protein